jgi:calcineurin-like phosphoesterase family protein
LATFARRADTVPALLTRLHGRKHLVRGNNDPEATAREQGWVSVRDYTELALDGYALVLCHYPFRSWNGQHRGSINLHGHSHGRIKPIPRQLDVGSDVHAFAPVTLQQLLASTRPSAPR